jgi:ABC-type glycerol-3-phosphate transport system substrate-binding protein
MKTLTALFGALLIGAAAAAQAGDATTESSAAPAAGVHRYLVERTFPAGALDGLDVPLKAKVNANNAKFGVHWVMSYANAAKTKTYCVYEGPSKAAIRKAATANALPIDSITEVPVTLLPK